jgi:integrase
MRVKKGSKGKTWYYLDHGTGPDGKRRCEPLGADFHDALRTYAAKVETSKAPAVTVPELLTRWNTETAAGRPKGTVDDIRYALPSLIKFFGDPPAPLEQVDPVHIRQYLDWRVSEAVREKRDENAVRVKDGKAENPVTGREGHARANREIAWLSAAWNWGRDRGITKALNPTIGIKRHKETGRDIYVEDDELALILSHADEPLQEAIELAYLIGQRPGDLRQIMETDIRNGTIEVEQDKTGAKLRVEVVGALAELIERIKARKGKVKGVRSLALICNESGQPLGKSAMRYRFDKARDAAAKDAPNQAMADRIRSIQFRDLRAKAASDIESLKKAQLLLGHTTEGMTEHYRRKRKGIKVSPVR